LGSVIKKQWRLYESFLWNSGTIFICGHGLKSMVTILVEPLVLFSFLIEYGPDFLVLIKKAVEFIWVVPMELWPYFYLWPWIEIPGYYIGRTAGSFISFGGKEAEINSKKEA